MKVNTEFGDAVRTTFPSPMGSLSKFAKVNGVLTAPLSQTENSLTFSVAPAANALVEIFSGSDIVVPPAVYTVSGVGAVMAAPQVDKGLTLFLSVSVVSGTTPSMVAKVQQLDLVSNSWFDVPGATFPAITAAGAAALTIFPGAPQVASISVNGTIRNNYRVAWTIAGTTPSFSFSIGAQS